MRAQHSVIAENIARIRHRIADAAERSGRKPDEITLIAVSKTFSTADIRLAYEAGVHNFGESRVQEMESKRPEMEDINATWHLIGHLQTNKVRRAMHLFDRVDSLDSTELARKLNSAAAEAGKILPVLIEVHLGGENTKNGVAESDLHSLAEDFAKLCNLKLRGLMTVPPYFDDPARVRPFFRKLRELRDALSSSMPLALPVLSMGMSHDFEIAIEEGATEVRIGSAIFGERPVR